MTPPQLKPISKSRFDYLCDHSFLELFAREEEWWSDSKEHLLGIILLDRFDKDWSWVVLCRDEHGRFRGIDLAVSISTRDEARTALQNKMREYSEKGLEVFPQNPN